MKKKAKKSVGPDWIDEAIAYASGTVKQGENCDFVDRKLALFKAWTMGYRAARVEVLRTAISEWRSQFPHDPQAESESVKAYWSSLASRFNIAPEELEDGPKYTKDKIKLVPINDKYAAIECVDKRWSIGQWFSRVSAGMYANHDAEAIRDRLVRDGNVPKEVG